MVEGWTCERCSAMNIEASLVCANCGATRPNDDAAAGAPVAGQDLAAGSPLGTGAADPSRVPADQGGVGWAAPWAATAAPPAPPDRASLASDGPSVGPPDLPPPEPRPLWRRIPIGGLVVVVLVVAGVVGGLLFNAGRSATGEINKAGDLTAGDIRVGDCFDLKDPTASDTIEKVTARPCTDAHQYEMVFVGSLPSGTYPPEKTFEDYVGANCVPAFAAYIGTEFASSNLDMYWLYPTDKAWNGGDRSVQCAVYDAANAKLTGSLKGSRR